MMLVQAFLTVSAIETLDVDVLCLLAGVDEIQLDAVIIGTSVKRPTAQIRAVINDQDIGVQRCVPVEMKRNRHGDHATTVVVGTARVLSREKWRTVEMRVCLVMFRPDARQIEAARRAYEDWWQAVRWIRHWGTSKNCPDHPAGIERRRDGYWGLTMAQMGFFDLSDRYASLDAKKDPLVEIDAVVPWEEFRPTLEGVWREPDAERKSRARRKPMDAVVMFKTLVLSALYNLSDHQI